MAYDNGGKEIPERLTPTKDTIRELFAKSGNICAFPGCPHLMVNSRGEFIAQICHIEAALPDGERFNPDMSNEQRREVRNLMLMCYEHHVVTNDEAEYTVERMTQMKADHEALFTDVERRIEKAFVDEASKTVVRGGGNLKRMNEVLAWGLDDEQLADTAADFGEFTKRLHKLPKTTRTLLPIIATRARRPYKWMQAGFGHIRILAQELEAVVGQPHEDVKSQVMILEEHRFAYVEQDEGDQQWYIKLKDLPNDFRVWEELKSFTEKTGTSLHELLVNLNFQALDG